MKALNSGWNAASRRFSSCLNAESNRFLPFALSLVGMLLIAQVRADEGPPDPISLDRASPSVAGGFGSTPGDIYDMLPTGPIPPPPAPGTLGYDNGGPGPIVHIGDFSYGLVGGALGDNNDGHSNGEINPFQNQLSIYFSGDDLSLGGLGTDYRHQAVRSQAAGDRFMLNGVTTLSPAAVMGGAGPSGVIGPLLPGGLGNSPINLLNANQHRYHEIPSIGPAAFNTFVPPAGATAMDDMDALELTPIDLDGSMTHTAADTPIYFSLDPISPSLLGSPADIQVTPPGAGAYGLYAADAILGLAPGDDVDALAVWDLATPLVADPGLDYALFSLAPGSPTLTLGGFSAADIFVTDFTGANALYLTAGSLGMLPTDNIDALDVEFFGGFIQEPLDFVPEPTGAAFLLLTGLVCAAHRRRRT